MTAGKKTTRKKAAKKKPGRKNAPVTYDVLKDLALSLDLPNVTEAMSWGQPCLKAHGKLWFFWSPSEDAPVFKVPFEERDMLVEADPETYFFTDHYKNHKLVLARPERVDMAWAKANLIRVWREMAPKRLLKAYDSGEL
ncbi:MmcQ/YjbR family DNA-binding protein [Hyphococcus sp.]|uniref:MmcQ/YjbR family DNA-binding protein n=1 Tax=Hyphococcus sp. TaxID=2038636 RepID=UPI0035C6F2F1